MYYDIDERVIKEAEYIISENATVRNASNVFNVSKSTIHHDVAYTLKNIDETLYEKVRKLLKINLSERHIRGGIATRDKYKNRVEKK